MAIETVIVESRQVLHGPFIPITTHRCRVSCDQHEAGHGLVRNAGVETADVRADHGAVGGVQHRQAFCGGVLGRQVHRHLAPGAKRCAVDRVLLGLAAQLVVGVRGHFGGCLGSAESVRHRAALAAQQAPGVVQRPEAVADHGLGEAFDAHAERPQVAVSPVVGPVTAVDADPPHPELDDRPGQHASGIAAAGEVELVAVVPAAGRIRFEPLGEECWARVTPDAAHPLARRKPALRGALTSQLTVAAVDLGAALRQCRQADAGAGLVVDAAVDGRQNQVAQVRRDDGPELLGSAAQQAHLVGAFGEDGAGARHAFAVGARRQLCGDREHLWSAVDAERPCSSQGMRPLGLLQLWGAGEQLDEHGHFGGLRHVDSGQQVSHTVRRRFAPGREGVIRAAAVQAVAVHAALRPSPRSGIRLTSGRAARLLSAPEPLRGRPASRMR